MPYFIYVISLNFYSGLCHAIGVSNYDIADLEKLMDTASITPHVNQVEFHPFQNPLELREFCKDHKMQIEVVIQSCYYFSMVQLFDWFLLVYMYPFRDTVLLEKANFWVKRLFRELQSGVLAHQLKCLLDGQYRYLLLIYEQVKVTLV